jgi:uncharacterized integral membrane protein
MIKIIQWFIGALTLICILTLIAINPQPITFNWNPASPQIETPLYLIILCTFAAGFLIGTLYYWLGAMPKRIENHKTRKSLEKDLKKLEKELETYKENDIQNEDLLRD